MKPYGLLYYGCNIIFRNVHNPLMWTPYYFWILLNVTVAFCSIMKYIVFLDEAYIKWKLYNADEFECKGTYKILLIENQILFS